MYIYWTNTGSDASTVESIFSAIDQVLESNGISWILYVGLCVGNTSVNLGITLVYLTLYCLFFVIIAWHVAIVITLA